MTFKLILKFQFLVFLMLFSVIHVLHAQETGSLEGYIIEEHSGKALADVNVRVKGTSFGQPLTRMDILLYPK